MKSDKIYTFLSFILYHIDIPGQYKMLVVFGIKFIKKFQKGMLCILLVPASLASLKG